MNRIAVKLTVTILALLLGLNTIRAQDNNYDVFKPIGKYLAKGDIERLSTWFANHLELTIFSSTNNASCNQAVQIIKSFFTSYSPRAFEITHQAGRSNMKYALGTLKAGGELFMVTIFISVKNQKYRIQQLKIERLN